MANKTELFKAALKAGLVPEDSGPDAYTADQLDTLLNPAGAPVWEGSLSATKPIVAPDGHVVLSQEDIDARA
jgi:hypothetical protein